MVKAQMKIQQTAFMLIALTIFFALVGMFALKMKMSNLQETAENLKELETQILLGKISNSPEFNCGESFGDQMTNCIDFDKAMVLKSKASNYSSFWGIENIEIIRLNSSLTEICTPQTYPNCRNLRLLSDEITGNFISTFITLCRRDSFNGNPYNQCEIAKLLINSE